MDHEQIDEMLELANKNKETKYNINIIGVELDENDVFLFKNLETSGFVVCKSFIPITTFLPAQQGHPDPCKTCFGCAKNT